MNSGPSISHKFLQQNYPTLSGVDINLNEKNGKTLDKQTPGIKTGKGRLGKKNYNLNVFRISDCLEKNISIIQCQKRYRFFKQDLNFFSEEKNTVLQN